MIKHLHLDEEVLVYKKCPKFAYHTAQMYNDSLYVWGGEKGEFERHDPNYVWKFDFSTFFRCYLPLNHKMNR